MNIENSSLAEQPLEKNKKVTRRRRRAAVTVKEMPVNYSFPIEPDPVLPNFEWPVLHSFQHEFGSQVGAPLLQEKTFRKTLKQIRKGKLVLRSSLPEPAELSKKIVDPTLREAYRLASKFQRDYALGFGGQKVKKFADRIVEEIKYSMRLTEAKSPERRVRLSPRDLELLGTCNRQDIANIAEQIDATVSDKTVKVCLMRQCEVANAYLESRGGHLRAGEGRVFFEIVEPLLEVVLQRFQEGFEQQYQREVLPVILKRFKQVYPRVAVIIAEEGRSHQYTVRLNSTVSNREDHYLRMGVYDVDAREVRVGAYESADINTIVHESVHALSHGDSTFLLLKDLPGEGVLESITETAARALVAGHSSISYDKEVQALDNLRHWRFNEPAPQGMTSAIPMNVFVAGMFDNKKMLTPYLEKEGLTPAGVETFLKKAKEVFGLIHISKKPVLLRQ